MNSALHNGLVGALSIIIMFALYHGGKGLIRLIKNPALLKGPVQNNGSDELSVVDGSKPVVKKRSELFYALIIAVITFAIAGIEFLSYKDVFVFYSFDSEYVSPVVFYFFAIMIGLAYSNTSEPASSFVDALWRVLVVIGCIVYVIAYSSEDDGGLGIILIASFIYCISRYLTRRIFRPSILYSQVFLYCSFAILLCAIILQFAGAEF